MILDVSYAQGDVDWSQVFTPDIEGAFIRVSHGFSLDNKATANVSKARHFAEFAPQKPWIGYYHFSEYKGDEHAFSPALALCNQFPADFYALDAETPCPLLGNPLTTWVNANLLYADHLPRRRNGLTWLYSFESFFHEHFGNEFANRPAWVAKVKDGQGNPGTVPPNVGYPYAAWQYSWVERHPGIPANVDASHCGPAFPGGASSPTVGGQVPNPVKTVVDPNTNSAWTLNDDGGIITEHGKAFYGAWGNLPAKTRQDAQVARFYDFTLRFDGKPGYTIWVLSRSGATLDYNFPLA